MGFCRCFYSPESMGKPPNSLSNWCIIDRQLWAGVFNQSGFTIIFTRAADRPFATFIHDLEALAHGERLSRLDVRM